MNENTQLREALARIAEIAGAAARSGVGKESPEVARVCTPKFLPAHQLVAAAQMATRINPVNAPAIAFQPMGVGDRAIDRMQIAVMTQKYWGPVRRTLSVSFMESTPADLRQRIVSNLNAWSQSCCISFQETAGVGNVRISRETEGYWSYVGTDITQIPENQPTMSLQAFTMEISEAEFHRVVRHEAGHTLAFPHEHMRRELVQRIDPEKAYAYFWDNYRWNRAMVDQQVLTSLDEQTVVGTPADQTSIMCYQLPSTITRDGQPILGGVDLNQNDRAFAGRIYPLASNTETFVVAEQRPDYAAV